MKKIKGWHVAVALVAMFGLFLFAGSAGAYSIYDTSTSDPDDTINVGDYDTYVTHEWNLNPSDDSELAWINSETGEDFDTITKVEEFFELTDGTGAAIPFGTNEPAYFLIKSGNLNSDPLGDPQRVTALFSNVELLNWGVVEYALTYGYDGQYFQILEIDKISHAAYPEGDVQVPEPTTMLLLGFGLVGLAGFRRKA